MDSQSLENITIEFLEAWGVEPMRVDVFEPYSEGCGSIFALAIWVTGAADTMGRERVGYVLIENDHWYKNEVVFHGADFYGSPLHATDSDETVAALMSFLTLRPGDADPEYFDGYSERQMSFAVDHGEVLSIEVELLEGDCDG